MSMLGLCEFVGNQDNLIPFSAIVFGSSAAIKKETVAYDGKISLCG